MTDPTPQERCILAALQSRPHWRIEGLLDELSRGRRNAVTEGCLNVYLHKLRARGHVITKHRIVALAPRRAGEAAERSP